MPRRKPNNKRTRVKGYTRTTPTGKRVRVKPYWRWTN